MSSHRCNAPEAGLDEPAQRHWECECGKRYMCVRYLFGRRPRWIWKQIPAGSSLNEHFDAAMTSVKSMPRVAAGNESKPRNRVPGEHLGWVKLDASEIAWHEASTVAAVTRAVQACGEAVDATRAALVASEGIAWQRGDRDPMVLIEAARLLMKELSEHFEPER